MKSFLFICIFCMWTSIMVAQTDTCIVHLKSANTNYDDGNYDQVIILLTNGISDCQLSKQDLIEVNKLLILSYIGIDNLEAANASAAAIMKIDPKYQPDKFKDDPKLTAMFVKFKPEPIWIINISGGLNFPDIQVIQTYSVVHPDDATGLASYQSLTGFQLNSGIEKRIYGNLWIEAGFGFRGTGYKHTLDSVQGTTIYYSEKLNYFDFPLSLKYYFLKGRLKPFMQAGVNFSWMLQAYGTSSREGQEDIVNRTPLRNNFDIGYFGMVGATFAFKEFSIFGNAGYTYFPDLVNKEGMRYADDVNLYQYYYVDDDFKMNNFQINAGVAYTLSYKITKMK